MSFARAASDLRSGRPIATSEFAAMHRLDRWGVWASVACAIHCLAAPLLFLLLPTLAPVWSHPSSHALIATGVLPLAGTVLWRGYRLHRRAWIAAAAILGGSFIVAGCVLPFLGEGGAAAVGDACLNCCPQVVEDDAGRAGLDWPAASIATMIGSVFLVTCHLGNMAGCRSCAKCSGS